MTNQNLSQKAAEKHQGQFQGEGLRNSQVRHQAFDHVNAEWLKKCPTIESALHTVQEVSKTFKDIEGLTLKDMKSAGASLAFMGLDKMVVPSETANGQLATRLNIPPQYLQTLSKEDKELYDLNVNRRLSSATQDEQEREVFLRLRQFGEVMKLRAMLSSRYAVINNAPILETIGDILPGARLSHMHYDGDTLRANILVPDSLRAEEDSDYGGGISVLNNETGKQSYKQRPFVFRHICWNGNIWDKVEGTEFNRKHLGTIDWAKFRQTVIMNIQEQLPLVQGNIVKVLGLKGLPVTEQDILKSIVYVGRKEHLTQENCREWLDGYKVEASAAQSASQSVFGMVQGLTRAAQTQERFEVRELMESLSARLIEANWEKTIAAARTTVEETAVTKVFKLDEEVAA